MAVTITQSPKSFTPSDNPIDWVFASDQYTQENFAFLVKVYVDGVLVENHYPIFPEVNSNTARFNAEDVARRYCSAPTFAAATFSNNAANFKDIYIEIVERYGDPIANGASATSSTITAFKAGLSDSEFVDWISNFGDYLWSATTPKFLSYFPRDEKYFCSMTETAFLTFLNNEDDLDVIVKLYDENGSEITNDAIATVSTSCKVIVLNCSPQSIIDNSLITEANFDSCSYYTIQLTDYVKETEAFKFYVDRSCTYTGSRRIHFICSIGSMESFTFNKMNQVRRDIEHNSIEKQFGFWDSDNLYQYNVNQGREIDFSTTSSGKMMISSDYLTTDLQEWLVRHCYESPFVFMEQVSNGETQFKRVKVLNTSYTLKNVDEEELIQETIEINLSDARKSMTV